MPKDGERGGSILGKNTTSHVELPLSIPSPQRRKSWESRLHILPDRDSLAAKIYSSRIYSTTLTHQDHIQPHISASLTGLPPELQISIFLQVLSPYNTSYTRSIMHQRTTLLLLSHQMHDLVMATPSLWAYISISTNVKHTTTRKLLSRAASARLWWVFDLRHDATDTESNVTHHSSFVHSLLQTYLLTTITQTTHLHVILDSPFLFPVIFSIFQRTPAPILQDFRIVLGDLTPRKSLSTHTRVAPISWTHTVTPKHALEDLFDGIAPQITSIKLHLLPIAYFHALLESISGVRGIGRAAYQAMRHKLTIQHLDLAMQEAVEPNAFYGMLEAVSSQLKSLALRATGPELQLRTPLHLLFHLQAYLIELEISSTGSLEEAVDDVPRDSIPATNLTPYSVTLPCLTSLTLGRMTSRYLGLLLPTLVCNSLTSLGIHGVAVRHRNAIWSVLSSHSSNPFFPSQVQLATERAPIFGSLETLELFDLEPGLETIHGSASKEDKHLNNSKRLTSFQRFLASIPTVTELRARAVGADLIKKLCSPYHYPPSIALHLEAPLPLPNLERLELCCITRCGYDEEDQPISDGEDGEWPYEREGDDTFPLKPRDLGKIVIDILGSRAQTAPKDANPQVGSIRRLHLDGDEWDMQPGSKEEFLMELGALQTGGLPSTSGTAGSDGRILIHWDARAPFFDDYYDSTEI